MKNSIAIILLFLIVQVQEVTGQSLYKTPLSFYNTDVLHYVQILYNQGQYEAAAKFFYGPLTEKKNNQRFAERIATIDFGYSFTRKGIATTSANQWVVNYQRTIMGTQENFKISCSLVHDTCKIYLDLKTYETLFR